MLAARRVVDRSGSVSGFGCLFAQQMAGFLSRISFRPGRVAGASLNAAVVVALLCLGGNPLPVQAQTTLSSPAPSIAVGTNPVAMAVNPATGQVYVANQTSGTVSVINGATNTVTATVPVGTNPEAVAVNPVTGQVYVVNQGSSPTSGGTVSVINGATNMVTATIPVGNFPQAVAVNAATGLVYVVNAFDATVTVIDSVNNSIATTISLPPGPIEAATVTVNPVTGNIYVTNNFNTVSVINGATNAVTATINVGTQIDAMAVNPVTGNIYVVANGTVSVIDGTTNAVAATIPVEDGPFAFAVNAVTGKVYVANGANGVVSVIDGANNLVTATVHVGSGPEGIAVNSVTGRVYVANNGSGTVSVIDSASDTVTATVTVGTNPQAVAVNPVTGRVYVANNGSGTVSVIGGSNNTVAATVPVGSAPVGVAVNSVTGQVYVANTLDNTVSVIDSATSTAIATITVGTNPEAVAVNSVTGQVYVANTLDNTVSVIDGATNTVTATITVGSTPQAIGVNPVTGKIYVALTGSHLVDVIDGTTNTVIATPNVGVGPSGIAVNAVTGMVYVPNSGNGTVSVIDGTINMNIKNIPEGDGPVGAAVNPVTGQVYVSNTLDNTVSVIDGASNTVTATIAVGSNPEAVAVNTVTGQVYVSNSQGPTVSVIDGATNTVIAAVHAGHEPAGVAVNAVTGQVYMVNEADGTVSVIDGQGTQGVPISITTQASATVPSPYSSSAATATIPYITTFPAPTFTATATSSYASSAAYSGIASAANPPLTALYYWLDDGSMSSWQFVAPSSTAGSNPATFPIALSGKKPGFYNLYMFAAYGNEGTPLSSNNDTIGTGTGNSPEISAVTAYPFYVSPIATTTVVQSDANPQEMSENVTLTAIVTPAATGAVATPTGTVNFFDGTTLLNTAPVSIAPVSGSNEASFQTSFSTTGAHSITAVFTTGDMNYFGSTSAALTENIASAPTVTGVSPISGPAAGGTVVTITGTSFTGTTSVRFGVTAASFTVNSSTSITAVSPAGTGTVDIVVINSGASATSAADQFTYIPPLMLASATLPAATAGSAYSQTLTASGGTTPYTYAVSAGMLPAGMSLNSTTGVLAGTPTAAGPFNFTVRVTDANNTTATASISLTVNAAVAATQAIPTETLTQNHGAAFTPVTGSGGTGALNYSISPLLPLGLSLSPSTGTISGTPNVTLAATTFTITVTDRNSATASNSFALTINHSVSATQTIPAETLTQNHGAAFTPVTGSDGTGALSYSISPTLPSGLSLSMTMGAISGTPTVTLAATTFVVTATDTNNATATNTFVLTINSAVTATQAVSAAVVTQNHAVIPFTPVTGGGGTGALSYSISPTLPAGLSFSSATGIVSGTSSVASVATTYAVTVTDANGATASNTFILTVNGPVTATTVIPSIGLTVDSGVNGVMPVRGNGGTAPLRYSESPTLPAGIAMSPATGAISGLPTNPTSAATYAVTVTDANGATATTTFSLAVNNPVTASTTIATEALTQNHAAAFTPVNGGGGTTPLSYSVSPSLPAGLSINSATGAVSGSPTVTSAATSYTVTVTDANSATAHASFSLTVNPAVSATVAAPSMILTQGHGAAPFTPVTGSGGTGALAYSISPTLPAGLMFSPSAGTISGAPGAASATTTYTVTVTDANGATASNTFILKVDAAVTATQAIPSEVLTQNHAVTPFTPVTGGGGLGPLAYSISPALPTGLIFSAASGVVSGTPSAAGAATTYTVTVTDANSATATSSFSLTINSAVMAAQTIAAEVLTQNHAAVPFTPVMGTGGTGTLTYSVSPGLPAGLNFNAATGVVSGTPSAASAVTTYTVTVTDANGATATTSFSLTVDNAATATTSIPSMTLTFYQATAAFIPVSGSGGDAPLAYSVTPMLPAGLAFSASTGAITGTPSIVSAATNYIVTVTDTNGATATASFSLAVARQASQTVVSVAPSAATPVQMVTLTATVSATVAGTPTAPSGTVTFFDNGTALMSEPVTAGVAQLTTLLPAGAAAVITATYSGDGNFLTSTSSTGASVAVAPLDFTFTSTGTSAYTAAPGAVATYSFGLSPLYGSYAGAVSFSVTGLPAGATASFTPSTVAAGNGTTPVVMTVQTASAIAQNKSISPFGRGIVLAFLLLPFVAKRSVREKMKGRMLLLLLLMAGVTATLTGCGSSSGFVLQSPQNYTLTVTATSGTLQHSEIVTLIVQ